MTKLAFTFSTFETLKQLVISEHQETCAILLAVPIHGAGQMRLLVTEHHLAPDSAYTNRSEIAAVLKPEFFIPLVKRAREEKLVVIFVHTHPGEGSLQTFSATDNEGERHLAAFMNARVPDLPHTALLLTHSGCIARVMSTGERVDIVVIGSQVAQGWSQNEGDEIEPIWDRQVRAFGSAGQRVLRTTRVAVVGCGGTGSIVAQQLAHLGVSAVLLVDPDTVELSNLNRVVGASVHDVGRLKVDVASDAVARIGVPTSITTIAKSVLNRNVTDLLLDVDAIFSCTDSHGSRAILNQIAYQYYIPVFDVGVSVTAKEGKVTHITGRTQMLSPGLGCLVCAQALDWSQVRRDLQTEDERRADPYIIGAAEPQPAVISINGTLSSLMITMFLAAFAGIPAKARLQYYDGLIGTLRSASVRPQPGCVVCSMSGALGRGNKWPLPVQA